MKLPLTLPLISLGLLCPINMSGQASQRQLWPELDVYIGLNPSSRVFLEYSASRTNQLQDYSDGQVSGYFDYFFSTLRVGGRAHPQDAARTRRFMFRSGYYYSRTPASGTSPSSNENTPVLLVDYRENLPGGFLITDRNRGDFQFHNGIFQPRYRNRLRFDRDTQAGRVKLDPYAYTEVFYETQYGKFNRFRFTGGLEAQFNRYLGLETYYTRQITTTSSIKYVNALGVVLQLRFR